MEYFVTGRGGFFGKNVCQFINKMGGELVDTITEGCTVVHLAAYGNHSFQQEPEKIIKANIIDLGGLAHAAQKNNVVKFYNISSSSVTLPVQTMYSASKMFGETMINALKDERFVNVRPYSVYGIGEADHRFIPTVIRHLESGETMKLATQPCHDWICVEDFVSAMFGGYEEIGTGYSHSNKAIVEMLENISGKKLNFEEANFRDYDNFSWRCKKGVPHRSIYEGLKQTYEYYTRKDS
jgi:nucleoside-diphosphate-sugar epimerase